MKHISFLFQTLVLLLCIWSCTKDPIETTGNIVGTVKDARTGESLRGASVTLSELGKSTTTGANGLYEFRDIESQNYTVQVSKANYKTDNKTIFVQVGKDNTLDFLLTPSVAILSLSQTSLDFGANATSLTFDIKNTGYAELTWSVSEDASWLSCLPTSGSTQPNGSSSVVVNVSREDMSKGNYSQTIAVASNGGSEVIRVSMVVDKTAATYSPQELDFGTEQTSLQLTLTNTSSKSVPYSITPSNDWVKVSSKTGSVATTEVLSVSVDRTSFSAGDYSGNLSLKLGEDDYTIPVRMTILAKAKPSVAIYSVDDITSSGAHFHGTIESVGSAKVTQHGFCWGTDAEPTLETGSSCNLGDTSMPKDFDYLASLEENTVYYVRAYAENIEGINYSNAMKFQTLGKPVIPIVETGNVTNIQEMQAQAAGNILSMGNTDEIVQYGHVWSVNHNPTIDSNKTELGSKKATGSFTSQLTGLATYTTYYVRAYATNRVGTAYGEEVSFTTSKGNVVLETVSVTNQTKTSATINCKIISLGGREVAERGVCWNTTAGPTVKDNTAVSTSNDNVYDVTISDLPQDSKFYVCAYIKTTEGEIFYGNEISFSNKDKNVIDKDDYTDDENWDYSQGNASLGKDGFNDDENWDSGVDSGVIGKDGFDNDENWD